MRLTYQNSLGIVWDQRFTEISFSHPMIRDISKARVRDFIKLAKEKVSFVEIRPEYATKEDLMVVHTRDYIGLLEESSKIPYIGFLDQGDTVHYPGMFEDILLVLGSSFTAIKYSKFLDYVYIPLGGFHHAMPNRAVGFCPINDVAITALKLLEKGERVAIVDVDAHHGNGLQFILYDKPILKINIYAYDGNFFPGTGKIDEIGEGKGRGYNINIPLPLGSTDDIFEKSLEILDLLELYNPSYVLVVAGVDGHKNDQLKSLDLTTNSYNLLGLRIRRIKKTINSSIIAYGGGGYGPMSSLSMVSFLEGLLGRRTSYEPLTSSEDIGKIRRIEKIISRFKTLSNFFS
ncbi:histone deacetylase family protein [Saccharolobus solfataricus]|nr:histone deacetylase family protein [Saccharolobus solfataricus]AKA74316.1 histone deacetylase family protein [Saccharolobus solfataricus]AKA77012.1 histone deacetylase family protein [Saccharolobus solfataricus]AKA79704.1 histone deacetylase family protein [Saccharolobus solfataricus]AZF68799.1 histone deacetylase family protein [Saccharolobus solfataricus]AZF71419.1 histone deacetylase family protein [Saccharolobus solfataricus]